MEFTFLAKCPEFINNEKPVISIQRSVFRRLEEIKKMRRAEEQKGRRDSPQRRRERGEKKEKISYKVFLCDPCGSAVNSL